MSTTNLAFENQVENTLQPGVAFNMLADAVDAALAGTVTVALADADATLTRSQWMTRNLLLTGALTAGRVITFPAGFPSQFVTNTTGQTLTLKKPGQTGITLATATIIEVFSGATDVQQYGAAGGGGGGGASVQTVTSAATVTPVATNDKVVISAQAVGLTIANPSGTAAEGQGFVIALYSAAAQTIAFGTDYRGFSAALPTTTIAGKWMLIPVERNQTDSKWDVLAVSNQL